MNVYAKTRLLRPIAHINRGTACSMYVGRAADNYLVQQSVFVRPKVRRVTDLAAGVERPVLAEGDHVVNALADGLGPNHRGRDAAVTDDLTSDKVTQKGPR